MTLELTPGLILILGALPVALLRGRARGLCLLALPAIAFLLLLNLPDGDFGRIELFGLQLTTLRVDGLSRFFGYAFLVAAMLGAVYALHLQDTVQHVAGLFYAGSALGAVFAGDLLTLFFFWELISVASVFLIWAARTPRAYRAGMRYLAVQIASGLLLLLGLMLRYRATGSLAFDAIGLDSPGGPLIFFAFGIKCAFPLLHNWLQDAYPEATVTGTVLLSAFTTKVAVYALARGFAGTELLVPIGAVMTVFPIFYAVIENDLRRVLAYSLNNQLGFMVVGIGIGTELALNGAVAHAFADIVFKSLLFMAMGAVLFRVGTVKGSELGGLYKSMPWTTAFCMVGAASISAFPLFSGFVTKSMVIAAAMEQHRFWLWLVLLFASAGVFHHAGIKIPYFAFFAHDSGKRCREAPPHMLIAMGAAAALCVAIGCLPAIYYSLLPFAADYRPYTADHVTAQTQLLFWSALAFAVLMRTGIYPPELRSTNLDADWFYRRLGRSAAVAVGRSAAALWAAAVGRGFDAAGRLGNALRSQHYDSDGVQARMTKTSNMVFWATLLLAVYLLLSYL
jgi:multicomponent Na+:H+ antiporter subunit D